jgi:tRNA-2-methylthio-N6-dimethylallyladenosine synthase
VLGTHRLKQLPVLIERAAADRGAGRGEVDVARFDDVTFPVGVTRRGDAVRAYVTIIEGCNDHCAFCVVPTTRGHERMRAKADILADVREAVASGRREIQLLGQIVNHYEAPDDAGCDFAQLLAEVDAVPGVERIRFASPHPGTPARASSTPFAICRASASTCTCRCSPDPPSAAPHAPAPIRARSILDLVGRIARRFPGVTLSTDLIVGFPARRRGTSTTP